MMVEPPLVMNSFITRMCVVLSTWLREKSLSPLHLFARYWWYFSIKNLYNIVKQKQCWKERFISLGTVVKVRKKTKILMMIWIRIQRLSEEMYRKARQYISTLSESCHNIDHILRSGKISNHTTQPNLENESNNHKFYSF